MLYDLEFANIIDGIEDRAPMEKNIEKIRDVMAAISTDSEEIGFFNDADEKGSYIITEKSSSSGNILRVFELRRKDLN